MRKVIGLMMVVLITMALALPVFAQDANGAHLRVGHYSPGAGDVDVYINGEMSSMAALAFGSMAAWQELPAGDYQIALAPAGTELDAAVMQASITLEAGDWVTELAVGELTLGDAGLHPVYEDYSDIVFGETRVTFVHAVPDLDPVDVRLQGGMALVNALDFPDISADQNDDQASAGYLMLDILEGVRSLVVTPFNNADLVLMTLEDVTLGNGMNNLIVFSGLRANVVAFMVATDPLTLLPDNSASEHVDVGTGTGMVRYLHVIPGAGAVNMLLNDETTSLQGASFGVASEWESIASGYYDAQVTAVGGASSDALITTSGVPLAADAYTTVAAIGVVELGEGQVFAVVENNTPINAGETRLALFHAISKYGPVDVLIKDSIMLLANVGYPGTAGASNYASADLITGVRDLQIVSSVNSGVVLMDLASVDLAEGKNNLLVIAGTPANPVYLHLVTDLR